MCTGDFEQGLGLGVPADMLNLGKPLVCFGLLTPALTAVYLPLQRGDLVIAGQEVSPNLLDVAIAEKRIVLGDDEISAALLRLNR